ncbi:unnamed protein product [Lasius platythorax]|uniref:Uncharacterized protein n=1 Tax=Lasius platythorax TaxID=488582 RepID=A0AAV2P9B2_9HYME
MIVPHPYIQKYPHSIFKSIDDSARITGDTVSWKTNENYDYFQQRAARCPRKDSDFKEKLSSHSHGDPSLIDGRQVDSLPSERNAKFDKRPTYCVPDRHICVHVLC